MNKTELKRFIEALGILEQLPHGILKIRKINELIEHLLVHATAYRSLRTVDMVYSEVKYGKPNEGIYVSVKFIVASDSALVIIDSNLGDEE